MSEELKPCPHCGLGGDEIELLEDRERVIVSHYVYCDGCGARTGYKFSGEAAIASWNRRAPSLDTREAVEALTLPEASDELHCAVEAYEASVIAAGGYKPAIATVLRIIADEMADKYPDDANQGRSLTGAKP